MIVIKNRKRLRGQCFGITRWVSPNKWTIEMSLEKNDNLAEYGLTLLHEFLHVWVMILKHNGGKLDGRKEHKFIYSVERSIINLLPLLKGKV